MFTSFRYTGLLLFAAVLVTSTVKGQVPDSISFQGYLTDPGGIPRDTTLSITFALYKGGTSIWSENQDNIVVSNGVFNAVLGISGTLDAVVFDSTMELGVRIKTEAEITPRTTLMAVPYALGMRGLRSAWAEGAGKSSYNLVGGALNNAVDPGVVGATLAGGGGTYTGSAAANQVSADFATLGGGISNTASGLLSAIGGGEGNTASLDFATVSGGTGNLASGTKSTVGGGESNMAIAPNSTVGGGGSNMASNTGATAGGGGSNTASGLGSTVGGGVGNTASGQNSTVAGGQSNSATLGYTFAAGRRAKANHSGTFVWADSNSTIGSDFASTGAEQFLIRAGGGVGIGTNSPDAPLDIAGGNNWDLSSTDGDLKIGNDTYRLEVGVSLGGGGAGTSRVNAVGGLGRLNLGGGETDVMSIDTSTGVYPSSDNTYSLGSGTNKWTAVWATNGSIQTSDARLKTAVEDSPYGLDAVLGLRPVVYRWTEGGGERKVGLIAQEVVDVVPEVVEVPADESQYYGMNYAELVPILIKAIQEQQQRIEELEARLLP